MDLQQGLYYPFPIKKQCIMVEEKPLYQSNNDRIQNLKAKTLSQISNKNIKFNKSYPFRFNKKTHCLISTNNAENLLLFTKGTYYYLNYY
tara:strand:- start:19237 stop:19506 length:270 start_codon:yes stop_codon:yes gene_type:complete